jgi:hypothetical protein
MEKKRGKGEEKTKTRFAKWESNRKKELMKNFDFRKSRFYKFAKEKGWLGSRKNEFMNLVFWRNIALCLSNEYHIKIPRDNWRYKIALFKWIDDNFKIFYEFLDSITFYD